MEDQTRAPDLEVRYGTSGIYVPPEEYEHVITVIREGFIRPAWIVVETDLWKLSIYTGSEQSRRALQGHGRLSFRRKKPYTRLRPEYVPCVHLVSWPVGDERVFAIDPYHDAVDRKTAAALMQDHRIFRVEATLEPDLGIERSLQYQDMISRARAELLHIA